MVRVVKGISLICDGPFPTKCEMAILFLVNRDFHSHREPLSSAEASFIFSYRGEVTSKCTKPGENRNESTQGTLGREKERRLFALPVVPRAPPIFHFSCVFFFFRPLH